MGDPFRFDFPADDPLGVLSSTAPVAQGATLVRIDKAAVRRFAEALGGRGTRPGVQPGAAPPEEALHCTFLAPRARLNYLLALEALNFCFWDEAPRWRVRWQGGVHDGYWALAAALRRAVCEDALPVWDARWLAGLDATRVAHLLRGEGRPVPLAEARLANLREAGAVLLERWEGEFANLVAACRGEAVALVRALVAGFPSFRDEARWRGRPVRFYKRAQICAADLARLLPDHPLGRLDGLERLTAFADYKVPQVLRALGILLPAPGLAGRIDRGVALPAGGEEEVELRAATVWACEWIARALNRRAAPGAPPVTARAVDFLLWAAGQDGREARGLPPYHRTRTIYY
jgi:hypothetical protein